MLGEWELFRRLDKLEPIAPTRQPEDGRFALLELAWHGNYFDFKKISCI